MAPPKQQDTASPEGGDKQNIDETVFGPLSDKDLASLTENMTEDEIAAMAPDEEEEEVEDEEIE